MTLKSEVNEMLATLKAAGLKPTSAVFQGAMRVEDDDLLAIYDVLLAAKAIEGSVSIFYANQAGEARQIVLPVRPEQVAPEPAPAPVETPTPAAKAAKGPVIPMPKKGSELFA
jgi:hypothetical protein